MVIKHDETSHFLLGDPHAYSCLFHQFTCCKFIQVDSFSGLVSSGDFGIPYHHRPSSAAVMICKFIGRKALNIEPRARLRICIYLWSNFFCATKCSQLATCNSQFLIPPAPSSSNNKQLPIHSLHQIVEPTGTRFSWFHSICFLCLELYPN